MPDSMDCGASVCVESSSSCCFDSAACWSGPSESVCSPSSSSSYDSGLTSRASYSSSSLEMDTSSLYGNKAAEATTVRASYNMDSRKSASEMVQDGGFVQSNKAPRLDQNISTPGEQPKVVVTKDASITPDYIVKQDGKIEVVGNPDSGDKPHSLYRIQVEDGANPQTTEALVNYLNDRIHQKDPSASVGLSSDDGLVSEALASRFNKPTDTPADPSTPPEDSTPPDDGGGGCPGGGGGGGGCDNSPGPSPEDTPAPTDNTTPDGLPAPDSFAPAGPMDNLLDAARLNAWDNNTRGSLGAYEINAGNWFSSWLDEEMLAELGTPPDFKKLGKVLAKHKNDPKFKDKMNSRLGNMKEQGDTKGADEIQSVFDKLTDEKNPTFAENFGIFLNSQKEGGRNATGEEMQTFFNKDLQRAIASSRMADIAHDQKVSLKDLAPEQASRFALAGALGHMPSEKEAQEYNQYMQLVSTKVKPGKPQG